MIAGTIRNPQVGKSYRIYLSTGETAIYIYRGFGGWMSQQWEKSATGEIVKDLPSMHGYEEV